MPGKTVPLSASLFEERQRKEKNKTTKHSQPQPVSALWAADTSFLYPTTKRHQWNQRGALERPFRARACHSVEVSSYPGARSTRANRPSSPLHNASLISPRHCRFAGIARCYDHSRDWPRGDSPLSACYQGGKRASRTVSLNADTCLSIKRQSERRVTVLLASVIVSLPLNLMVEAPPQSTSLSQSLQPMKRNGRGPHPVISSNLGGVPSTRHWKKDW